MITQPQWDDWLLCLQQKQDIGQDTTNLAAYVTKIALKQGRNDIAAIVNFYYGVDYEQSCHTN